MHGVRTIDHKGINAIAFGWRNHPYYAKIDNNNRIIKEYEETKIVSGAMYDSILDSDGNIIFIGHGLITATNTNALRILKVTPELVVLKEINLTAVLGCGFRIKQDSLGNYFICGTSHTIVTGIIIKLDINLNILVAKTITGPSVGNLFRLLSLEIDSSNNVAIFGASDTNTYEGTIIMKYDNNLNKISAKVLNYYDNTLTLNGGIISTTKDVDGNIYGVGISRQWDNTNNTVGMIYRMDSNLNIIGIKDVSTNPFITMHLIDISHHNGFLYVTTDKSYILKFDLNLVLIKTIKFTRSNNPLVNDLYQHTLDNKGNLYAGGYIVVEGKAGSLITILNVDNDITTSTTTNGLYIINTTPIVIRNLGMVATNINVTEGSLSSTNTVVGTTFTEVTNTIVHMDL